MGPECLKQYESYTDKNRTHMWVINSKMPLEAWCGCKLNISHLQEFGSPVWILNEGQLTKLQPRSTKHTFVGFMAIKYYDASSACQVSHATFVPLLCQLPKWMQIRVSLCCKGILCRVEGSQCPTGQRVTKKEKPTCMRAMTRAVGEKENSLLMRCQTAKSERTKRQKETHNYHLLDNPWADDDEMNMVTGMTSGEMARMTSAERVYVTSSGPNVMPDNPKSLHEAQESPDWPNWEVVKAKLDQPDNEESAIK